MEGSEKFLLISRRMNGDIQFLVSNCPCGRDAEELLYIPGNRRVDFRLKLDSPSDEKIVEDLRKIAEVCNKKQARIFKKIEGTKVTVKGEKAYEKLRRKLNYSGLYCGGESILWPDNPETFTVFFPGAGVFSVFDEQCYHSGLDDLRDIEVDELYRILEKEEAKSRI